MTSDLPGGMSPDELGPDAVGQPGLQELLRTLTSPATAGELAGEQDALTMFRANVRAPASAPAAEPGLTAVNGTAVAADALAAASDLTGTDPGAAVPPPAAGGTRPMRQLLSRRAGRPRAGWPRAGRQAGAARGIPRLRLAAVTATVVVGGFATAAYMAVLPAPVQHAVYLVGHDIGVPDSQPAKATGSHNGSSSRTTPPSGHSSGTNGSHPTPSGSISASHPGGGKKSGKPSVSPTPSVRPSPSSSSTSPATGPVALTMSVQAPAQVPAGTSVTFQGQLTIGGNPDANVFVRLMERKAGHLAWERVDRAETNSQGVVTLTSPALSTNAAFRLAYATGTRTSAEVITVVPGLTASLRLGPKGIKDYLSVSTTFAEKGNVVLLQVLKGGSWVTLQQHDLNAKGATVFIFSATKRENEEIQAVLQPTRLHAGATSTEIMVPAPA
jgi:hypothetical protein